MRPPQLVHWLPALILIALGSSLVQAQSMDALIIRRSLQTSPAQITSIDESTITLGAGSASAAGATATIKIAECIGAINTSDVTTLAGAVTRSKGVITLADGQRLPGELGDLSRTSAEQLSWRHPWLGQMDVPLKSIQTIELAPNQPIPTVSGSDVVLLANGDRYEGLITAFGSAIAMEIESKTATGRSREVVSLPMERVVCIAMVTPRAKPAANARRVWFADGTVVDVQALTTGEDGSLQLVGSPLLSGTQIAKRSLNEIKAVLFDPAAMQPFASLSPSRLEGPATRYVIPKPVVIDPAAALGLSPVEFHGPLVARYALPAGSQRLAAEARIPEWAREWGDCELVIRSDDAEVFRAQLNASSPQATVNVPLKGRELTIELTAGAHGPIQDVVRLERAMLMMTPR
jgi:hypothetical protein